VLFRSIILEKTNKIEWQGREKFWIKELKIRLTNETDGGEGLQKGFKHKKESVKKIVTSLINRSPEIRKQAGIKTSLKLKGKKLTEKHKKKLSSSHKVFWRKCPELKKETIIKNLDHGWSSDSRKKLSNTNIGKKHKNSTSNFKGVSWFKRDKCWRSWINKNKKQIHLGYFKDEISAALAYDEAARKYHGEFARTNF